MTYPNLKRYPHIMLNLNKSKVYEPMSFKEHVDLYYTCNMKNTDKLSLNGANLISLDGIEEYTSLEKLYIDENSIIDLEPLRNLKKLILLDIKYNKVESLEVLKYSNIEILRCSSNNITDPEPIHYMNNLKELTIYNNNLTGIYEKFNNINTRSVLEELKSLIKYDRRKRILKDLL